MKKLKFIFILSIVLLIGNDLLAQQSITFLHTNDMHASYTPKERDGVEIGGMLALNYYVKEVAKEVNDNYLMFDAGDIMTGNPVCDIDYKGIKGGILIYFMNYIGYHGLTLGNHEFDISVKNADGLMKLCEFPVFCSNVFYTDGKLFAPKAYHIYEKANLRTGVIGIIVHDLDVYLQQEQKQQIYSRDALPIVESIAEKIDPLTDLIVVLSHSGIGIDKSLAKGLSDRVDIIIGGHTHTVLEEPEEVNGKIIVQTGSNTRYLGRLDVTVAADTVQSYNGRLIKLDATSIEPEPELAQVVDKYTKMIDDKYGEVIGTLKTPWVRNAYGESNLGNYIADCIRKITMTDFAVINSGGIRNDLQAGEIKAIDIKKILPFDNQLCTFEVTGEQLGGILRVSALAAKHKLYEILQVSGISYCWKMGDDKHPVVYDVFIDNEPIDSEKIYKGATVDYVLANTRRYFGMESIEFLNLYTPMTESIINATRELKIIDSKIEGRIIGEE